MDFISDNNPKHLKQVEAMLGGFPEYVKDAYSPTRSEECRGLHKSAFATPSAREYPINSKDNVFLGYAYAKSAGAPERTLENLKSAAKRLDVDLGPIDDCFKKEAGGVNEDDYALVVDLGEGEQHALYPIKSAFDILDSANQLTREFGSIPLHAFRKAALAITKAAAKFDMVSQLPKRVRHTGANRQFNPKSASRFAALRRDKYGDKAGDIYDDIVKAASEDPEQAEDFAKLAADMDEFNNVVYTQHVSNPYESFFTGHDIDELKKAAESLVVVSGTAIPMDDFVETATQKLATDFRKADRAILDPIVKAAKSDGGIITSGRLDELDESLQARFLHSLAELDKYAATSLAPQQTMDASGASTPVSGAAPQPSPQPATAATATAGPGGNITPAPAGLGTATAPTGAPGLASGVGTRFHTKNLPQAPAQPAVPPTGTV